MKDLANLISDHFNYQCSVTTKTVNQKLQKLEATGLCFFVLKIKTRKQKIPFKTRKQKIRFNEKEINFKKSSSEG